MTTLGWVFMSVSLLVVWIGTFWCFWKVLETPEEKQSPPSVGP